MDKTTIAIVAFAGYILLPLFLVILFLRWRIAKSGERPPVYFVLRRGPGESLRRRLIEDDENFLQSWMIVAVAPLAVGWSILMIAVKLGKPYIVLCLILAAATIVAGVVVNFWWFLRYFRNRRNCLLGYLGERAVAEELESLQMEGFRVFHDVPVEKVEESFNLDHVVVGPTGLFAVETKTRRKGRARPGHEDHKVFYDGKQLIWPWGEDTYGLRQATNEADWLTKWVKQMTGLEIHAKPILALPGWWVESRALGAVSVQNPKNIPTNIRGKGVRVLDDMQIDLIARQLDARCRDVRD